MSAPTNTINSTTTTTIGVPAIDETGPCFEVKPTPDKGMAVFATRAIPQGGSILEEAPLVVRNRDEEAALPWARRLSQAQVDALLLLHHEESDVQDWAEGVRTANKQLDDATITMLAKVLAVDEKNAFRLSGYRLKTSAVPAGEAGLNHADAGNEAVSAESGDVGSEEVGSDRIVTVAGLFVQGSRFSHSCSPNAVWIWNTEAARMCFLATRDIPAGQEIAISYIPKLEEKKSERQALLKQGWNFDCACDTCGLAGPDAELSELRRATIQHDLHALRLQDSLNLGLGIVQACEDLMGHEGLEVLLQVLYARAYMWARRRFPQHPNAISFLAEKAAHFTSILCGPTHQNTRMARDVLESARSACS